MRTSDVEVDEGFRPSWSFSDRDLLRILESRISRIERELALLRSERDELDTPPTKGNPG